MIPIAIAIFIDIAVAASLYFDPSNFQFSARTGVLFIGLHFTMGLYLTLDFYERKHNVSYDIKLKWRK